MTGQSDLYKNTNAIEYLADFPGARRETDRIVADINSGSVDVTDRNSRRLGTVRVTDLPEPLDTDLGELLATNEAGELLVQQSSTVTVAQDSTVAVQEDTPLDVSASTVPVRPADTVAVQEDTPLDVSASTVTVQQSSAVDVSDRAGRALGTVSVDAVNDTVATEDADSAAHNAETVAADGQTSSTLSALGADRLAGRVEASGSYSVELVWLDDSGAEVFRDTVASGVAGGTATELDELAIYSDVQVVISDDSSAENTVSGVLHLR